MFNIDFNNLFILTDNQLEGVTTLTVPRMHQSNAAENVENIHNNNCFQLSAESKANIIALFHFSFSRRQLALIYLTVFSMKTTKWDITCGFPRTQRLLFKCEQAKSEIKSTTTTMHRLLWKLRAICGIVFQFNLKRISAVIFGIFKINRVIRNVKMRLRIEK